MHIDLPTLTGLVPREAERAILTLRQQLERAHASVDAVTTAVAHPGPLTAAQVKQVRDALQANGSTPLNVTALIGTGGASTSSSGIFSGPLLVGTHAQRLSHPVPSVQNTAYFEIDRDALYVVRSGVWQLEGNWLGDGGLFANIPADLGLNDNGFRYWALDQNGVIFQWTGNLFRPAVGYQLGTLALRPLFSAVYPGLIFVATDMGDQAWLADYALGTWFLLEGWGGPAQGTISPDTKPTALLTANDVGFRFYSTDFDREYRWTGAAWADAPNQPQRGLIAYFEASLPPGTGWAQCIGIAGNRSNSAGGTTPYVSPTIANQTFIRAVTGGTGATGGSLTTSSESADTSQLIAAGATSVPASPHTHTYQPPFFDLQAYVRL